MSEHDLMIQKNKPEAEDEDNYGDNVLDAY